MNEKTIEIKHKMKKVLDKDRYQHTLGVAYTASCLAMRYELDPERLFLAGLLHDCAKNIPNGEKYALCKKYKIVLMVVEILNCLGHTVRSVQPFWLYSSVIKNGLYGLYLLWSIVYN